jgi:hypothetical protein
MEAAGSSSTSAEESKLHLVFCTEEVCQQPPMSVCYQSELECREHCDPKCQLQASLLGSEN